MAAIKPFKSRWTSKYTLLFLAFGIHIMLLAQPDSLNATRIGKLTHSWNLNDVWGYADTTGNEYALVGAQDGLLVVNVTQPANPSLVFQIPGAYSIWRDIKTWKNYAYVVHDFTFAWNQVPQQGVMIVNMDSLTTPKYKLFRPQFSTGTGTDSLRRAHNIWIDEFGVLYVFGSNINGGGALMFDVATDPWNPVFLGNYSTHYLHDGYARNDTLYGAAVNDGMFVVVDVTLKSSPQLLKTQMTPTQLTHNTWLSDDGNTLFTTDETSGGYVAAYDISNLNNITELDKIRPLPGTGVIPHNVHVFGDFLVTSHYTRGVHIVDAKYPDLLVEVAYYDTSPNYSGNGFNGAWGAYPYLPSGNILVSDIESGLNIVQCDYPKASRIFGLVKDSLTGNPIFAATAQFSVKQYVGNTNFDGTFKAGFAEGGADTIFVTKSGYYPAAIPVNLSAGIYDSVTIALLPLTFQVDENNRNSTIQVFPNPSSESFYIRAEKSGYPSATIVIYNMNGMKVREIDYNFDESEIIHQLPSGMYIMTFATPVTTYTTKFIVE